jgi:hypothetical protein
MAFTLPSALDRWFWPYLLQARRRWSTRAARPIHLLIAICDHFEPHLGEASDVVARRRVDRWVSDCPRRLSEFRDNNGRPPRHSFFYPVEAYHRECVSGVTEICRQGFGEIEIHLHHDNDTPENLRRQLNEGRQVLAEEHGQLAIDRRTGEVKYGFIHGNWALNNSHPHGRWCGVNDEIRILRETGCYADFTMPSAPERAQTRTINSIYYAGSRPDRPCGHDAGVAVGTAPQPADTLMLIQGPLVLSRRRPKWGVIPRVENGCIQGNQPATVERVPDWIRAGVRVPVRPDWVFVKLHTHGANEGNMDALLGEPMQRFHAGLRAMAEANPLFHYHYVTAREMYNLARAAEAGWAGTVDGVRDHELVWGGARIAVQTSVHNLSVS